MLRPGAFGKDGENTVADDECINKNVTGIKTSAGSVIINRKSCEGCLGGEGE